MAINERQDTQGKMNFRCSDVGPKNCNWQVSGDSEEEIMPQIEQHGREKHNSLTMKREVKFATRSSAKQHNC
jgi:predicted small metal-binding protein